MKTAILFVVFGVAAWPAMRALTPLFVNTADVENPLRRLTVAIGYVGLAAAVWGVFLLAVRMMSS
jgi:hypothetical protein